MWSREKTNLYVEDKLCEQKVWLNHYFQTKFAMANNVNIPPPKSCLCIVALCFRHIIEQNFRNSRCKITFPVWVWETLLMPLLSDPTSSHETLWTLSELREFCHLSSRNKSLLLSHHALLKSKWIHTDNAHSQEQLQGQLSRMKASSFYSSLHCIASAIQFQNGYKNTSSSSHTGPHYILQQAWSHLLVPSLYFVSLHPSWTYGCQDRKVVHGLPGKWPISVGSLSSL